MDLLVTEFKKGKKILEKSLKLTGDIKPDGYTRAFTEKNLAEILSNGTCRLFDGLDKAGKHFRKSWKTRYTSKNHKTNDFSSIQSKSSLELQMFYKNMTKQMERPDEKPTQATSGEFQEVNDDIDLGDELKQKLRTLDTKIKKEIASLCDKIKCIPSMQKAANQPLRDNLQKIKGTPLEKEYKEGLESVLQGLDSEIQFTDQDKKRLPMNSVTALIGTTLGVAGAFSIASIAVPTVTILTVGTGGIAGAVIGGCSVVVVGALALGVFACSKSKRLQDIAAKRYQAKIYDHMRKIVKYTNQANRAIQEYNRTQQNSDDEVTINEEHRKFARDFISKQKALWEKYATAAGRDYRNSKDGKHTSGLIKRSDDRQNDKLQCAKRAIANTWRKIRIVLKKRT